MQIYKKFFKPAFFGLDPEISHELGMLAIQSSALVRGLFTLCDERLHVRVLGCDFPNPIGLAAGFDKNGEAVSSWQNLGFGFCEIGTVTAKPQAGNPKPRLFRLPEDQALINRMGFNNHGAEAIARHLRKIWLGNHRPQIPVGINIGKSKDTPLQEASQDYLFSLEKLYEFADYLVVNVSSPNTPGLRDLQEEKALRILLDALLAKGKALAAASGGREKAMLVKFAPDLDDEDLRKLLRLMKELGVAGVILGNTTLRRDGLTNPRAKESGGLSGLPLRSRSTEMIQLAQQEIGKSLVLIGCGGVFSAQDAREKIQAGASLVQIYTGLIYEGPALPKKINQGLLG